MIPIESEVMILRLKKEIADEESAHALTIQSRDDAEEAFTNLCALAGVATEFSNIRSFREISDEVADVWHRQSALVSQLAEALQHFADIEVPEGASDGCWVAKTAYCNNQITAFSVRKARSALAAVKEGLA